MTEQELIKKAEALKNCDIHIRGIKNVLKLAMEGTIQNLKISYTGETPAKEAKENILDADGNIKPEYLDGQEKSFKENLFNYFRPYGEASQNDPLQIDWQTHISKGMQVKIFSFLLQVCEEEKAKILKELNLKA